MRSAGGDAGPRRRGKVPLSIGVPGLQSLGGAAPLIGAKRDSDRGGGLSWLLGVPLQVPGTPIERGIGVPGAAPLSCGWSQGQPHSPTREGDSEEPRGTPIPIEEVALLAPGPSDQI